MKKHHLIIIATLGIAACKTRQISTEKLSSLNRSTITQVVKNNIQQTDTTKILLHTAGTRSINDSFVVSITPDTGSIEIKHGNYIGRAGNVVIEHASTAIQSIDDLIQQNKGEVTQSTINDSITQKRHKNGRQNQAGNISK